MSSNSVSEYLDSQVRALVRGRDPSAVSEALRVRLRDELLAALGLSPLPERTPLNAWTTGRLERSGYVIEKVVIEPLPKFYATSYLYIPTEGRAPFPAVVSPVGHWPHKKLQPTTQARCIGLALYGFVVLCIDMPGFSGENSDERSFPGTHCDWRLHLASLPPLGMMVWDAIRGIDYLTTRPEVDSSRLGMTGDSGGGMVTMYSAILDHRIACYVPVCYAVSYEDNYDNGCYCNHVPGVLRLGDRSDVMALAAPKPVLLIGAEDDPEFPKSGTLRAYEKLSAFYKQLGREKDCQVFVAPGNHDYSRPMRERMYGFFRKYLQRVGDGGAAPEPRELPAQDGDPAIHVEDPTSANSFCFPGGEAPCDAKSLLQLAREKATRLVREAQERTNGPQRETLREHLLQLYPLPERVPLEPEECREADADQELVTGSFVTEPGLRIAFRLRHRPREPLPVRILFSDRGLSDQCSELSGTNEEVAELRLSGRGLGGGEQLDTRVVTYLGRPAVMMWAWDVSRAVDYLHTLATLDLRRLEVWGVGPAGGQVALLAALIDPRIVRVFEVGAMQSYLDAFDKGEVHEQAMPARILEVGDLPLIRSALREN